VEDHLFEIELLGLCVKEVALNKTEPQTDKWGVVMNRGCGDE